MAREFDDGITSHWFPVYNAPEINVRPAGPPVNAAGPHDSYARLIYLYVNSATLWPIDTPDIASSDARISSRSVKNIYADDRTILCADTASRKFHLKEKDYMSAVFNSQI